MRILPAAQNGVTAASPNRRAAGTGGFTLTETSSAKPATPASHAPALQSLDALLALQGVEDEGERRRRFARRGSSALELLDKLKLEILDGNVGLETLRRLEVMLESLAERSGERGLDDVLEAIGVRVAVEIAKRRPERSSAA